MENEIDQKLSDGSSENIVCDYDTDRYPKTQSVSSNQNASTFEKAVEDSK